MASRGRQGSDDGRDNGGLEAGAQPDAPEGLAWLGRPPSARSNPLYTAIWYASRLALWISGLRVTVEGAEHRPRAGGYVLAIGGHRRWLDGPLVYIISPREPRIWYLGNGVAIFRRRWLERLLHAAGGMLPVYRGGTDVTVHLESARAVLGAGAVLAIYPEGTRHNPPAALGRFRHGAAFIALRTGATVVPVALAGTVELYRGRRIVYRLLPPVSILDLAGLVEAPAPDSPAEREAVLRATEALRALIAPHYEALAAAAEDPPEHRRRWRWMTGLFD